MLVKCGDLIHENNRGIMNNYDIIIWILFIWNIILSAFLYAHLVKRQRKSVEPLLIEESKIMWIPRKALVENGYPWDYLIREIDRDEVIRHLYMNSDIVINWEYEKKGKWKSYKVSKKEQSAVD